MCLNCWEAEGRPFNMTEAVRRNIPLFQKTDKYGACHIVVEDWNLDDGNLDFCKNYDGATTDEKALMDVIHSMSWEERWALAIMSDYPDFDPEQEVWR